ncbi:MAG: hypothetical protein ACYCYF_03810 [Anaerolineae bacterium]
MFDLKPDYEDSKRRIEAFWEREIIDRPVVQFSLARPVLEQVPLPFSRHATLRDRWLDADYQARYALATLTNHEFLGDTLPIAFPNLGPELFAAFYGCPLHFGESTSWTDPILHDWADAGQIRFDATSPYLAKLHEMTDAFLSIGRERFITGMTDWHPGGDWLAALRDPATLAVDLITNPDDVQRMLVRGEADYLKVYDGFYDKLRAAGQPITTWLPLISEERYYVPSNDFSYMISNAMFERFFLPGLTRECQFLSRSIYHLDGPGALRHLDSVLCIRELDAVQWVFGAGNEGYGQWVDVYRRIQRAGKGVEVICTLEEVEQVMETLSPKGLYLSVDGVPSHEAGIELLERLSRWCTGRQWLGAQLGRRIP